MLFNSYPFLFFFFPLILSAYWGLATTKRAQAKIIIVGSLIFYGWWDYRFLGLLISSIVGNYAAGCVLRKLAQQNTPRAADLTLGIAIAANLFAIGVFKYAHFFAANINFLTGSHFELGAIILPLGISFFTFEQISFLTDVRRGDIRHFDLTSYMVFVAFFPRLIAGPILRYDEIAPQLNFRRDQPIAQSLMIGLTIFFIGLVKKSVLADGVAPYVSPAFTAAGAGEPVDLLMSWGGVLSYTCQLYFDFSGYSDMAIGIARCFGIRFPMNFFSPYKATSIIEFWQSWHISLSRFLRDYVYIGLGGNRRGRARRYLNLMLTMLLGGLWHGASWTFIAWGGLHGIYLMVNHGWRSLSEHSSLVRALRRTRALSIFGWALTFICVVVGWVFFRANNFHTAIVMLQGMSGLHGISLPSGLWFALQPISSYLAFLNVHVAQESGNEFIKMYLWIFVLLLMAFVAPATQQVMAEHDPILETSKGATIKRRNRPICSFLLWEPTRRWAIIVGTLAFLGAISITHVSEFLYWQF